MQRAPRPGRFACLFLAALCAWNLGPAQDTAAPEERQPAAAPAQPEAAPAPPPATPPEQPVPPAAVPAEATPWLTAELLQTRLAEVSASVELTAAEKETAEKLLRDAVAALAQAVQSRQLTAATRQEAEAAPAQIDKLRADLKALDEAPPPPFVPVVTATVTSRDLEQQLRAAKEELTARQRALEALETDVRGARERQTGRRERVTRARERLSGIEAELAREPDAAEKPLLSQARRLHGLAASRMLRAQLDSEEARESTHDVRVAMNAARRDWTARQIKPAEDKVKALEDALSAKVEEEAQIALAETQRQLQEAMDKVPQVAGIIRDNVADRQLNAELVQRRSRLQAQPAALKRKIEELERELADLKSRIEKRGLDQRVARELLNRRRSLPTARSINREIAFYQEELRSIETKQEALQAQQREFDNFEAKVKSIMDSMDAQETAADRAEIESEVRKLFTTRRQLINEQTELYAAIHSLADQLEDGTHELRRRTGALVAFIDTNLLWVADAPPLSAQTARDLAAAVGWLLTPANWTDFVGGLRADAMRQAPIIAAIFLLWAALLALRPRIQRKLAAINDNLKRVKSDGFAATLLAMALTLLLALPWPLLVMSLAAVLRWSWAVSDFSRMVGVGLFSASVSFLAFWALILFLRPGGLAQAHLRWCEQTVGVLRRNLMGLMPIAVPFTGLVAGLNWLGDDVRTDSLGRVAFMLMMLAFAVFLLRVAHPRRGAAAHALEEAPASLAACLRWVWYPALVLMPPALAVLAGLGYFYTAQTVGGTRMMATMWLLLSVLVAQGLLLRWLFVAKRRLALQKALERREARAAAEKDGEHAVDTPEEMAVAIEQPTINLAQLDEQTRQLFRAVTTIGTLVGLYLIWAGVLPALRVLDTVVLWQAGLTEDNLPVYVTLASVLLAVAIGFITLTAGKNVPGLLEIIILKRTKMDAGGRYAFATVSRYVITAVGVTLTFGAIGIGWSSVQWLVAAVSVGLGFGLQEIFANFVSGLIILFERPVRVGDVVTVGDVSGSILRIRIRATTVVDWDNRELIVPNKEFITGRIMNWTLSNSITRVVIRVGVAYGSDTALVQRLLQECAAENPLVLSEPKPTALFMGFGDSSLDFELRFFTGALADRLPAMHQIHEAIDCKFRQNGVEIPFPQRDVHLHSADASFRFDGAGGGKGGAREGGTSGKKASMREARG